MENNQNISFLNFTNSPSRTHLWSGPRRVGHFGARGRRARGAGCVYVYICLYVSSLLIVLGKQGENTITFMYLIIYYLYK